MNSEIYLIDLYASTKDSLLHRCSYIVKISFTSLFLMLIISSRDPIKIAAYSMVIISLIILAKLPLLKMLKWSAYSLIFGLMFALSQLFYSYPAATLTVLKVFTTVSLMLWFITTTGFMQLFSAIPSKTMRNMLLLTYRFFFMILDNFSRRLSISRIRGSNHARPIDRIRSLSDIIAHELIHTLEKAERVYKIMAIRGFAGKLTMPKRLNLSLNDTVLIAYSIGVMMIWSL